jgi:hypothetical protein
MVGALVFIAILAVFALGIYFIARWVGPDVANRDQ